MAETIKTKRCPKCKQFKKLSEFHKDRATKDGLYCYCKPCQILAAIKYQKTPKGKAAYRRYQQSEKGKATHRKRNKKYQKTAKCKATQKRYARHPSKIKAVNAVNSAIRAGKLPRLDTKICHYCPKPAQQYHHWHGYEPEHFLDVLPVCKICHRKIHVKSTIPRAEATDSFR